MVASTSHTRVLRLRGRDSCDTLVHTVVASRSCRSAGVTARLRGWGVRELPVKPTGPMGMGWCVGPVNGIPAVFHQGKTFTFHSNIVLMPESHQAAVLILMNPA